MSIADQAVEQHSTAAPIAEESKDNFDGVSQGSKSGPKFTLFIKNLSKAAEEEDIRSLFTEKAPEVQVLAIRLIRDKVDSSKRGIAFVDVAT